ncbi:hypothetical protein JYU34_008385, partial [Plutella xylostella]
IAIETCRSRAGGWLQCVEPPRRGRGGGGMFSEAADLPLIINRWMESAYKLL